MKMIVNFFDKIEDFIRGHLSRYPIAYALIGGVGVVLFWRGVWITADLFEFMTGPISIAIAIIILGLSGILVSEFIGEHVLMASLRGEKKLEEKTREEILKEDEKIEAMEHTLETIQSDISEIKDNVVHK